MKLLVLIIGLVLSGATHASSTPGPTSPGTMSVTCKGNISTTPVDQTLQFGGANLSKQDFAFHEGVFYAIQLGSYKGFIDIILLQETRDTNGNILTSNYVRTHGGTELDVVDNIKNITLICELGAPT